MRAHFFAALLAPTLLAACAANKDPQVPEQFKDYSPVFPLSIVPDEHSEVIALRDNGSPIIDKSRMQALVLDHARHGHGSIDVTGPYIAVRMVSRVLFADGASSQEIEPHVDAGMRRVVVGFATTRAVARECGTFKSDSPRYGLLDPDNTFSSELGCTTQSNFAAMVSDPVDTLRRRAPEQAAKGNALTGRQDAIHAYVVPEKPKTSDTSGSSGSQ